MFNFHVLLSCIVIVYCFHVPLSCTAHVLCSCNNFIYCIHVLFMYYFHILFSCKEARSVSQRVMLPEMKTHEHGYHVDLELSDRSRE